MLEINLANPSLKMSEDVVKSPGKKPKRETRLIQDITNVAEQLRTPVSPVKPISPCKPVKALGSAASLKPFSFKDQLDKENQFSIPPTDQDLDDSALKNPSIPNPPSTADSEESKEEPLETSSISPQVDLQPQDSIDLQIMPIIKKAQSLLSLVWSAFELALEKDPLIQYWHANPLSSDDFRAFDAYNDIHNSDVTISDFRAKKKQLEILRKAPYYVREQFFRDFIACFNSPGKCYDDLMATISRDRYLSLDYLSYAKRLANPAVTDEEFSSIVREMAKEVSRFLYVADLEEFEKR